MTVLEDRLGAERAARVIERAGGERITIPRQLDRGPELTLVERKFGKELAIVLVLHFGGELLYVPNNREPHRRSSERYSEELGVVVRLTRKGRSASYIARRLQCSTRSIYAKRARARELDLLPAR